MFTKSGILKFSLLLACAFGLFNAATYAQSLRKKISFDDGWKFSLGHSANPKKDFNYGISTIFSKAGDAGKTAVANKFNDSSWRTIHLPHDWAVELPFYQSSRKEVVDHGFKAIGSDFPENNIGWYRKTFTMTPADSGVKYTLQFDGVYRDCKIFLNEHYLGGNFSGYSGFELDITDYINYRDKNVLTVRVDASQAEGWFYEGAGIYRHVWLNKMHPLHIATDGVFVYTKTEKNTSTVTSEITLQNQSYSNQKCTVLSYIVNKEGEKVAFFKSQDAALKVNESKTLTLATSVAKPQLWDIDNPYLYRAYSLIQVDGKTVV